MVPGEAQAGQQQEFLSGKGGQALEVPREVWNTHPWRCPRKAGGGTECWGLGTAWRFSQAGCSCVPEVARTGWHKPSPSVASCLKCRQALGWPSRSSLWYSSLLLGTVLRFFSCFTGISGWITTTHRMKDVSCTCKTPNRTKMWGMNRICVCCIHRVLQKTLLHS